MDLTMYDLGLLADPLRCSEVEPAALEAARFFVELPELFDRQLSIEEQVARTEFARALAAHWPAGPTRPHEVTLLLERYADSREPSV